MKSYHPDPYYRTLRDLKDIYGLLDTDSRYLDFSLLFTAKQDLTEDEVQWQWDGSNRDNTDQIIREKFVLMALRWALVIPDAHTAALGHGVYGN